MATEVCVYCIKTLTDETKWNDSFNGEEEYRNKIYLSLFSNVRAIQTKVIESMFYKCGYEMHSLYYLSPVQTMYQSQTLVTTIPKSKKNVF